jgi:hypothetical protein
MTVRIRRRRARDRRGELTWAEHSELMAGQVGYPAFPSERARRAAWEAHGAALIAEAAARAPGERPEAFWRYHAPPALRREAIASWDPRLVLTGRLAGPSPREQQDADRIAYLAATSPADVA